jgi:hypothetical protein
MHGIREDGGCCQLTLEEGLSWMRFAGFLEYDDGLGIHCVYVDDELRMGGGSVHEDGLRMGVEDAAYG